MEELIATVVGEEAGCVSQREDRSSVGVVGKVGPCVLSRGNDRGTACERLPPLSVLCSRHVEGLMMVENVIV